MEKIELFQKVKIRESDATGTVVDVETKDGKTYYCVEYDDEFKPLDEEMGIAYCKKEDLEVILKSS